VAVVVEVNLLLPLRVQAILVIANLVTAVAVVVAQ
jgi:hypothetical protein